MRLAACSALPVRWSRPRSGRRPKDQGRRSGQPRHQRAGAIQHLLVGEDGVKVIRDEGAAGSFDATGFTDVVALFRQIDSENPAGAGLVVDDENASVWRRPAPLPLWLPVPLPFPLKSGRLRRRRDVPRVVGGEDDVAAVGASDNAQSTNPARSLSGESCRTAQR